MCVSHTIDFNNFYKFLKKKKIQKRFTHHSTIFNQYDNVFLLLIVCVTIYCPAQYLPNTILYCSAFDLFKQKLFLCLGVQHTPILQTCNFQSFSLHQMGNRLHASVRDSAIFLKFSSTVFLTTTAGSYMSHPDDSKFSL